VALQTLFTELDRDGSGRVSHEEFTGFVMEAFANRFIWQQA
jgi:hypothetical protein